MRKQGKRAVILTCAITMLGQSTSAEEWFEKRDAKKCTGAFQTCIPDMKALGWGFVGETDEHQSRREQKAETWAKGRQLIVCYWRKDGSQDVSCEVTSFDEE